MQWAVERHCSGLQLCATLHQQLHGGEVPSGAGQVERALQLTVQVVHVCTVVQQQLGGTTAGAAGDRTHPRAPTASTFHADVLGKLKF